MINKQINKLAKSLVEVTITSPWEDVAAKWDATLQKLSQDVELPGFRKGQAPLPQVQQHLGPKLQDEFFKVVFPQLLVDGLQGSNIIPIDYPRYQLISFAQGQPLTFKATITERPQVSVGDYKNIRAQRPQIKTVTDQEIEKIVQDLYSRWKARNPQTVQSQPSTQPGIVPSSSGSMTFGGQPQVSGNQPDDNFAKAMGAQDVANLKIKIKTDLEAEAKYNNELDYEEAILQEVEKITTVDIPQVLVEDELHRMLVSLQRRIADTGLLMDEYLKSQKETFESLRTKWLPQAEKNVRMELGLSEIARMENVSISDSELQAEIDRIQDQRLKAQFGQEQPRMQLRHSLRQVKTLDLLKGLVRAG